MLQRAASNAYSWWWASHIRTTQSKWLDANLQDVENRVKIMLKLLGEEADSFGKRAEMYYRRRPEVINHVEDVYRAYRALVERYDHLSKELHKANHTIATACPDEVQYAMLEEEDDNFPRAIMPINSRKIQKSTVEDILKRKREGTPGRLRGLHERPDPHMTKDKAEEEIGRLQKAILIMQTEKEFVKSSYESGIAKYWELEKQIADMQEEICHMQDEFDAHAAIEDDEARALMTITALRSCQGTVAELVKKFEDLIRSAKIESEKLTSFREKLYAMSRIIDPSKEDVGSPNMTANRRIYPITQEILELQTVYDKIEDFFENNSESSVEEMAYKVDELVDKIIDLELKFPKQSAQIKQLKEENENIKNKLDDLQDEMALLDDPSDSSEELKLVEDAFNRSRVLEGSIIEEEVLVSTAFSEILNCITNISKAFGPVGPEDLPGLSAAAGDDTACSEDVCTENATKDSTKMNEGEIRGIKAPTTGDILGRHMPRKDDDSGVDDRNSSGGTDGVYDRKNGAEENVPLGSLIEEEFRDKNSNKADTLIGLTVSSDNENALNKTCEDKIDSSSEGVEQSSSGGKNRNGDMGNDGLENFAPGTNFEGENSPTTASQTHLLPSESMNTLNNTTDSNEEGSSVEVAESSFGGDNRTQDLKIDGDENVHGNSLIQEEGFGVGNGELPKPSSKIGVVGSTNLHSIPEEVTIRKNLLPKDDHSCSGDADKNLDSWHAGEELPKEGGQIAPESIEGLNKHGKVESSDEGVRSSFDHMNAYPLEAGDETSLCVPARDSDKTGGMYLLVSEVQTDSLDMASQISDGQLEKKTPNVEVLAREKRIFSNHGSRGGHDKSTLVSEEDVPSWPEFLLDGLEGRDAILLADYTSVLRNYKETKRRLAELEKKNQEHLEDTKTVIRELRNANSMKYVEIQSLKGLLDSSEMPPSKLGTYRSNKTFDRVISVVKETDSSGTGAPEEASPFEMKFRTEIDGLVEENLRFLARYSMACHQMQEFSRKYQELQHEMESPENKKAGGEPDAAIEPGPAEKKLRELRTEVDVWFEQNALLDRDLQLKTASLCSMQEEIAEALRSSTEADGARFTPYEAARFQGEVQNMQQSNNRIGNELQAALERMRELEGKVNETLRKLRESLELSSRRSSRLEADTSYQNQFKHFPSRRRVPLRNFLFGTKPKKKSIFACINPTYQRQFSDF